MTDLEWAKRFAQAAREIAEASGSEEVLHAIAQHATDVAGCQWAAIARASKTSSPVVVATNDRVSGEQIAAIQASGGGGPTWAAIQDCHSVHVPDVSSETRWPAHIRELMTTTPVRSIFAHCLELDGEALGALTLYAQAADAFPPAVRDLVAVYADHAAIALDHERTNDKLANMDHALHSNREIGMAIGILIERHKVTPERGFDMLRIASQHAHRKLHEIAADLVHTGELLIPATPDG